MTTRSLALALLASALTACDSKETAPSVGKIGAQGGVARHASGASVALPAGAVARDVDVAIAPKDPASRATSGTRVLGQVWSVQVDGQEHFAFAKPVRLTIPFDPSRMSGGASVALSEWRDGRWNPVPGSRADHAARTIAADVDHFSEYAPTQDEAPASSEEEVTKRLLNNKLWYGQVSIVVRGTGRRGSSREGSHSSYAISRHADAKFLVRANPGEIATISALEEMERRKMSIPMPPEMAAQMAKLRRHRTWLSATVNRVPEDETELALSIDDRYDSTAEDWGEGGRMGPDEVSHTSITGGPGGRSFTVHQLSIDLDKGTYSLLCPGIDGGTLVTTSTGSGSPATTNRARAIVGWQLRDEPLPTQGNVLSGTRSIKSKNLDAAIGGAAPKPDYGSVRAEMTWMLSPVPLEDLEVVVKIADYESWLPEGTRDESERGNTLTVEAELRRKGGGAAEEECEELTFYLNSDSVPGSACNSPLKPARTKPDLVFEAQGGLEIKDDGLTARAKKQRQVTATLSCYDWGAWGTLRVEARTKLGRWFTGYLEYDGKRMYDIRLPRRAENSVIGDKWKEDMKVSAGVADDADTDAEPAGDGFAGDGLTLYEEYRGFVVEDGKRAVKHERTDPKVKDYFVCVKLDDPKHALGKLEDLTGFKVRRVPEDRHENRAINFNRALRVNQRCLQHLVILDRKNAVDAFTAGGRAGGETVLTAAARSRAPERVTPVHVERVWVGSQAGVEFTKSMVRFADGKLQDTTQDDMFIISIVHELLHAVGAPHHGALPNDVTWTRDGSRVLEGGTPVTLVDGNGQPLSPAAIDALFEGQAETRVLVTEPGGVYSGDQACIMRYAGGQAVRRNRTDARRRVITAEERAAEAWGVELCTSKAGTGVNAGAASRYGAGTVGGCKTRLRVCDATK